MDKSAEAFRTISEVADDLGIPKHVLRFWEVKFVQIRPMKRGGGRRYYRPEDMELLRGVQKLLHRDGYTIKGVQKILREQGTDIVKQLGRGEEPLAGVAPKEAVARPEGAAAVTARTRSVAPGRPDAPARSPRGGRPAARAAAKLGSQAKAAIGAAIQSLEECRTLLSTGGAATIGKRAAGERA